MSKITAFPFFLQYSISTMISYFGSSVPTITAEKVKEAVDAKADILLLDVRTPQEYANAHLDSSINVPVDEISKKIEKIITDKAKTIYVYCLSGARSSQAVNEMIKRGYSHVYSMKNGMLAWRIKGYPIYK